MTRSWVKGGSLSPAKQRHGAGWVGQINPRLPSAKAERYEIPCFARNNRMGLRSS